MADQLDILYRTKNDKNRHYSKLLCKAFSPSGIESYMPQLYRKAMAEAARLAGGFYISGHGTKFALFALNRLYSDDIMHTTCCAPSPNRVR